MKNTNQVPDWNRDKSWDKIERRLEKKKRRFIPFWWLFGGSVMVALLVGIFIFGLGNSEFVNQEIRESITPLIRQNADQSDGLQPDSKVETTNKLLVQKEMIESDSSNNENSKHNKIIEHRIEDNSEVSRVIEEISGSREATLAEKERAFLVKDDLIVNLENQSNFSIIDSSDFSNQLNSEVKLVRSKLESIPFLSFEEAELFYENKKLELPNQLLIQVPNFKKEAKPEANWLWSIESGFDFGTVNHTGENDYSNRKNTTEDFRFVSTTTFGLEKEFPKKWYLRSGVTFQTIFEKYDATAISTDAQDVFRDSAFVYYLNDNQAYYEPGIVTETTTYNRQIIKNNFLYRWSIPITFGKKFTFGKIQLTADLGLKPQFYQYFSGIVTDEDYLHVFDKDLINSTYYKNDFDLGLTANISARYSISSLMQIGFGFRFEKEDFLELRKDTFVSRYEMVGGYFGIYRRF